MDLCLGLLGKKKVFKTFLLLKIRHRPQIESLRLSSMSPNLNLIPFLITVSASPRHGILNQAMGNHLTSIHYIICLTCPCHPLKESDLAITNPLLASTGIAHFLKICFVPLLLQKICVSTVFD